MDGDRFDTLTRGLAASRSRRAVLRVLAGAAGGGLLALVGRAPAGADPCKGTGKECKKGIQCCSGSCAPPTDSISTHGSGSICCPAGQVQHPVGVCCTPTPCAAQGKNCGEISDDCGRILNCGSCTAPDTCGGDGTLNVCGCTPTTCAAAGAECGAIADECGGTLPCPDTCLAPETCGGGPDQHPNLCGCTPATCQVGQCGAVPDSCGLMLSCGICDASQCLTCDETSHACVSTCTAPRTCVVGACKLPDGATGCTADEDCASNVCVAGTCQAGLGGEGAACDGDADCVDGRSCVNTAFGFGVCCASATACGTICCASGNQICDPAGDCCTPLITSCPAQSCDLISDECGTVFDCGTCGGGQECIDNVCQSICKPVLAACTEGECCADATCRDGGCCQPPGTACSLLAGGGNTCCEENFCLEHPLTGERRCQGCTGDFNKAFGGAPCISNNACCSGYCHTPSGNCCRTAGAECSQIGLGGFECCPYLGLTCSANGNGVCVPCRTEEQSCAGSGTDSTCCLGFSCDGGTCVKHGCSGLTGPCQEDSACCPGMECDEDRGVCFIVCLPEGQVCDSSSSLGCCDGLSCLPGFPLDSCRPA